MTGADVGPDASGSSPGRKLSQFLPRETVAGIIAIAALALAWHLASIYGPSYAFPTWGRIARALINIPLQDVGISIARLAVSMLLSFVIGMIFSTLVFERPFVEALLLPLVRLLMAVPAVCWVIFAILWFKGVEFRIFFVMSIVCTPVFIIDSLDAMKGVPLDLRQMVRSFRPDAVRYYTKLIFPSILPYVLTSWKINLTLAVRVVTIAELVGAVSGIGHGLVIAQEMFSIAEVFAWTVVLVLILLALQGLVNVIERRTLHWRTA
ncbi:MAG: ABC transporter permease subunit [Betaproteobacteria bacterium]|nr:ABC transporter permease subunit [Betaproteobacteria bacterium]